MADKPPVLDYAGPPATVAPASLPWQTITAIVPLLIAPMTACLCGHLDWFALPFSTAAASLAWLGFCRNGRWSIWRLLVLVVAVLASLELVKNLADILWFGHQPLLRRVRWGLRRGSPSPFRSRPGISLPLTAMLSVVPHVRTPSRESSVIGQKRYSRAAMALDAALLTERS